MRPLPPWLRRLASAPGLALALPLALAVTAYWRVLPGQFQFDDELAIVQNPAVKDLPGLLAGALGRLFEGGRPVTDLTFALNYTYGRLEPWNYHLTNLLIHLAAVVLAWAVGRQLLRMAGVAGDGLAVAAAGLFALHPLQSQAVSYVVQRGESLASALYLAALLCLLLADRRALGWRGLLLWLGAALAFLLALGAKTIAVTLPAAWLLLAALVPSPAVRPRLLAWRHRLLAALPLLALAAVFSLRTLAAVRQTDAAFSVPGLTPWLYLRAQLQVVTTYLRLLAWPAGQTVDWRLDAERLATGPGWLLAGAFLLALAGGALALARSARRRDDADGAAARLAGAGVLWFFLVLAPTSSVVPIADLLVEHRVYLASFGLFLAVAAGGERLLARLAPAGPGRVQAAAWLGPAVVCAAWLGLAGLLHARNAVWETGRALWSDAVAKTPDNPRAWLNLGHVEALAGRPEESVAALRRALPLAETDPRLLPKVLVNLGSVLAQLGRFDEAEGSLRRAVALAPWDTAAVSMLVLTLLELGRPAEAEAATRRMVEANPQVGESWSTLGEVQLAIGNPAGALASFEKAVELEPDAPARRFSQVKALVALDRTAEACAVLAKLQTGPDGRLARVRLEALATLSCP